MSLFLLIPIGSSAQNLDLFDLLNHNWENDLVLEDITREQVFIDTTYDHNMINAFTHFLGKIEAYQHTDIRLLGKVRSDLKALRKLPLETLNQLSSYTWQYRLACYNSAFFSTRLDQQLVKADQNEISDLISLVSRYLIGLYQSGNINQFRKNHLTSTYSLIEKMLLLTTTLDDKRRRETAILKLFAISRMGEFQNNQNVLKNPGLKRHLTATLLRDIEPLELALRQTVDPEKFGKCLRKRNALRERYITLIGNAEKPIHESWQPKLPTMAFFQGQSFTFQLIYSTGKLSMIAHEQATFEPVLNSTLALLKSGVASMRGGTEEKKELQHGLRLLYKLLMPEAHIARSDAWVIDADGLICQLPFETLVDTNGQFQLQKVSFQYVLGFQKQASPIHLDGQVSTIGGEYSDPGLKLPQVTAELGALKAVFNVTTADLATPQENNITTSMTYMATHQVLGTFGEPILLVSEQDSLKRSAFFTTHYLSKAMVLNACASMAGTEVSGEGNRSFANRAIEAGASQAIANLWQVEDATASEVARLYIAEIGKGSLSSKSLTSAKRSFVNQADGFYSHPFFWSPMLHIGTDVHFETASQKRLIYLLLLPLFFLLKWKVRIVYY